ncbi:hypothetical protein [Nostoc sp. FACHB-892]|uniref:hypothetical protein n=1 Tax=Nostoc sp. FACHB-892 TaxID=2692843 RepID=UPI001F5514B5|nr:hypothetical protein [Nostoc sp. FACHB-892]
MSIPQFLTGINGIAQLWAADGQFLGLLSSDRHDPNSISNLHGIYGSTHGTHSIRNFHGMYGGSHGSYSPYNLYCNNPPFVIYQGQPVLTVTRNAYAQTNGLSVIDPDFLLDIYVQLNNSANLFDSAPIDWFNQAAFDTQQNINQAPANEALANPTIVILEPEQSPPIFAQNHFVRAEVYSYPGLQIKDGIGVSLKLGATPQDTYLTDSSGVDTSLILEVNHKTGEGFITGYSKNAMPVLTEIQPFKLSLNDPYSTAISYACAHYLNLRGESAD